MSDDDDDGLKKHRIKIAQVILRDSIINYTTRTHSLTIKIFYILKK